jgi:hypothetical protein
VLSTQVAILVAWPPSQRLLHSPHAPSCQRTLCVHVPLAGCTHVCDKAPASIAAFRVPNVPVCACSCTTPLPKTTGTCCCRLLRLLLQYMLAQSDVLHMGQHWPTGSGCLQHQRQVQRTTGHDCLQVSLGPCCESVIHTKTAARWPCAVPMGPAQWSAADTSKHSARCSAYPSAFRHTSCAPSAADGTTLQSVCVLHALCRLVSTWKVACGQATVLQRLLLAGTCSPAGKAQGRQHPTLERAQSFKARVTRMEPMQAISADH